MNSQTVLSISQNALETAVLVSAPLLLTALIIGLVVSILQAATQINEATLSFIPKLVAILVMLVVAGPWMITMMVEYMRRLLENLPFMIG